MLKTRRKRGGSSSAPSKVEKEKSTQPRHSHHLKMKGSMSGSIEKPKEEKEDIVTVGIDSQLIGNISKNVHVPTKRKWYISTAFDSN